MPSETPADLAAALRVAGLGETYAALPASHRKEYEVWIEAAKRPATRVARIAKAVEMLHSKSKV